MIFPSALRTVTNGSAVPASLHASAVSMYLSTASRPTGTRLHVIQRRVRRRSLHQRRSMPPFQRLQPHVLALKRYKLHPHDNELTMPSSQSLPEAHQIAIRSKDQQLALAIRFVRRPMHITFRHRIELRL